MFALGLIHANHGKDVVPNLLASLKGSKKTLQSPNALEFECKIIITKTFFFFSSQASNETVQHGACLGLGVAAMATDDEEIFEELKAVLFSDSAIAGEAAGLAMGLVMLGTASTKAVDEMVRSSQPFAFVLCLLTFSFCSDPIRQGNAAREDHSRPRHRNCADHVRR